MLSREWVWRAAIAVASLGLPIVFGATPIPVLIGWLLFAMAAALAVYGFRLYPTPKLQSEFEIREQTIFLKLTNRGVGAELSATVTIEGLRDPWPIKDAAVYIEGHGYDVPIKHEFPKGKTIIVRVAELCKKTDEPDVLYWMIAYLAGGPDSRSCGIGSVYFRCDEPPADPITITFTLWTKPDLPLGIVTKQLRLHGMQITEPK